MKQQPYTQPALREYILDDPYRAACKLLDRYSIFRSYYVQNKMGQLADELIHLDHIHQDDVPSIASTIQKTDYVHYGYEPVVLWGGPNTVFLSDTQMFGHYISLQEHLEQESSRRLHELSKGLTIPNIRSLIGLRESWIAGANTVTESKFYIAQLNWAFGHPALPGNDPSITVHDVLPFAEAS